MLDSKAKQILDLLENVNNKGIKIHYSDNKLSLRVAKGEKVEESLLQQILANKEYLITYLQQFKISKSPVFSELDYSAHQISHHGQQYYEITATQEYWINENIDKKYKELEKTHGAIYAVYEVSGGLNTDALRNAISFMIDRHEVLRATFHKINDRFYMKIADIGSNHYDLEVIDRLNSSPDGIDVGELVLFNDKSFLLNEGPLFLSRLIKIGNDKYLISLKIHHVIFDSWSKEILTNELMYIYRCFNTNVNPQLERLQFQFKEFLSYTSDYNQKNQQVHKEYWENLYLGLPEKLSFSDSTSSKEIELNEQLVDSVGADIPCDLVDVFDVLKRKYSTTTFVILQTVFKAFIFYKTGQHDLTIGTYVAGRDLPETNNLIGSFARTCLLRTVFQKNDTLSSAIEKVKKSNADMSTFKAYSLKDHMSVLYSSYKDCDPFWQINMLYSDNQTGFYSNGIETGSNGGELELKFVPVKYHHETIIPIDFVLDFTNLKNRLVLNFQYDSSRYAKGFIQALIDELFSFAYELTDSEDTPLRNFKKR